jgi:hypothetical protein
MFSTTKLLAGAATLALASTLLWSAVPTPPQEGQVLGAEAERSDFIIVTGTSTMSGGTSPSGDDSMSDPRVSGHVGLTNSFLTGDGLTGVNWGQYTLANDDGSWEGEWIGIYDSPGDAPCGSGQENAMIWASGTGEYEGWTYVANYTGDLGALDVKGLLYQDEIPPTVALGLLEAE